MKKWIILLTILLALPGIALAEPQSSANSTTLATTYNENAMYSFQITWVDQYDNVENATFRLGTAAGAFTNYTNTSTDPTVYNASTTWMVNFTQVQLGQAGTYNFTWIAINLTYTENSTDMVGFTVAKNSTGSGVNVTIYTFGSDEVTHNITNTDANSYEGKGNPYSNCSMVNDKDTNIEGTSNLWKDGVAWTKGISGAESLGRGSYTIKCNMTGNVNYSNNNTGVSHTFTILSAGGGGGGGGYSPPVITPRAIPSIQIPSIPSVSLPTQIPTQVRERIQAIMTNIQTWLTNIRLRLFSMFRFR